MENLKLACAVFVGCLCMSCANCMDKIEKGVELHITRASETSDLMAKVYQQKPIVQYSKIHIHNLEMWDKAFAVFDNYMLSLLYPHLRVNGSVCVHKDVEITQNVMSETKDLNNANYFRRSGNVFTKIR